MVMLSPEEVKAAKPILALAILVGGGLAALMVAVGAAAMVWSPNTNSVISAFGFSVTTGSIAVALITLGAITAVIVLKKVLEVVTQLAKLK